MVDWCKKNTIRVVFDTDDALDLVPPENLNYKQLQPRLPLYRHSARSGGRGHDHDSNAGGLPAAMESQCRRDAQQRRSRRMDRRVPGRTAIVRIGWTGSPTHFADLAVALDAVRDLQKKYPFTLVLQGHLMETDLRGAMTTFWKCAGQDNSSRPRWERRSSNSWRSCTDPVRVSPHGPDRRASAQGLRSGAGHRHRAADRRSVQPDTRAASSTTNTRCPARSRWRRTCCRTRRKFLTAKNNREAWKQKLEWALNTDREPVWREQRDWVLEHRNIEKNVELWESAYADVLVRDPASTLQLV